jgi:hypothetical protein
MKQTRRNKRHKKNKTRGGMTGLEIGGLVAIAVAVVAGGLAYNMSDESVAVPIVPWNQIGSN